MDYKAELIRLKQYCKMNANSGDEDTTVADKFAILAYSDIDKCIDQILKRGEEDAETNKEALDLPSVKKGEAELLIDWEKQYYSDEEWEDRKTDVVEGITQYLGNL